MPEFQVHPIAPIVARLWTGRAFRIGSFNVDRFTYLIARIQTLRNTSRSLKDEPMICERTVLVLRQKIWSVRDQAMSNDF